MVAEQEVNGDESDEAKKLLTPQTQKTKKMSLSTVVGGMSLRKQMLFKIMPDSSKQTLKAYCKKKATMTTAACQTDPIPRKITCPNSTITRSNDDVNDLLLMSFWD
uniref:Uncharacterized protein n=1 Tax=Plectus sambesii TaxID=2011161 RepID=A0A914X482_9BILA